MLALLLALLASTWRPDPIPILPDCPTEDSVACTWHADRQGNGQGRTFTTLPDGRVLYWPVD